MKPSTNLRTPTSIVKKNTAPTHNSTKRRYPSPGTALNTMSTKPVVRLKIAFASEITRRSIKFSPLSNFGIRTTPMRTFSNNPVPCLGVLPSFLVSLLVHDRNRLSNRQSEESTDQITHDGTEKDLCLVTNQTTAKCRRRSVHSLTKNQDAEEYSRQQGRKDVIHEIQRREQ